MPQEDTEQQMELEEDPSLLRTKQGSRVSMTPFGTAGACLASTLASVAPPALLFLSSRTFPPLTTTPCPFPRPGSRR